MFEEGKILDNKYKIIKHIGTGGGGIVYKAYHITMNRYVAIKQVKSEVKGVLGDRDEADILKGLKNDYIPAVYDFIPEGDEVYTVMEFVEGQSFEQLINSGKRFAKKRVMKFARQLCQAAAYLHSRKPPIIHSDIKPANIMLTPEDNICLIDYNISLIVDGNENAIGVSEGYSPPEQYGKVAAEYIASGTELTEMTMYESSNSLEETNLTNIRTTELMDIPKSGDRPNLTEFSKYDSSSGLGETDLTSMRATELTGIFEHMDRTELTEMAKYESSNGLGKTNLTDIQATDLMGISEDGDGSRTEMTSMRSEGEKGNLRNEYVDRGKKMSRRIDKRSDIYSIGATLYAIASGKRPDISVGEVVPFGKLETGLGESFTAIIEKAMAKKPENRFSGAEQMLVALNNIRRYDRRYKNLIIRQELAAFIVIAGMAVSCLTAVMGYMRLGEEDSLQYETLLSQMDNADISDAEEYCEDAAAIFPDRAEAYEKMALMLYNIGEYDTGADYIENVLDSRKLYIGNAREEYSGGLLYYILGRCCMETGEKKKAVEALERAVEAEEEISYYCDYAVALAQNNEPDRAAAALDIAVKKGLSGGDILFVHGEIEFALENYDQCIANIKSCISEGAEKEYIYRAYMLGAKAYSKEFKISPEVGEAWIEFLRDAIKNLPVEKTSPFYEMLAQGYIEIAKYTNNDLYYSEALAVFDNINNMGWETLEGDCNMLWIYRKLGNYPEAKKFGKEVINKFGENYSVYKRLAFIESDIQNQQKNSLRDYSEFCHYYERAEELCTDPDDPEMAKLAEAYRQAKER